MSLAMTAGASGRLWSMEDVVLLIDAAKCAGLNGAKSRASV